MSNITRAEAAARAAMLRSQSYEVTLDLTRGAEVFGMQTRATFECVTPGASSWIDLIAPTLHSATLNGVALDVSTFDGFRIPLPNLQATNVLEISADCAYMNTGEGLHRFVDPVDSEVYLYTQFETADARRMYACFEQPDLKATFQLTVTAPEHWQVVSNYPGAKKSASVWEFEPTPRISSYITALVAGPYASVFDSYTGPHGTYPLGIYCRASLAQYLDPEDIFLVTKQGFEFFERSFGVGYPFAKYDQLFVPEFNAGAMENAGCVTFREEMVFRSRVTDASYEQRSNTILHELAHMWFGDLVTMTWWDDLWLNESFAEWAAHHADRLATRFTDAWTTFLNQRKAWAYRQDQLPSTHPIAADMVDLDAVRVNFDGITYAKGASALRQLVAWVGEEEFLRGIQAYFTKHAWGNTELNDLFVELEAASGRDLSGWSQEWLQTSGVNLMRADISLDADGNFTSVVIVQEPPTMPEGIAPTLRSHRMAIGLYDQTSAGLIRRDRIELDVIGARTEVPQLAGQKQPDLLLLNDDDLTFTKIRLDERSWRTAVSSIGALESSMPRALIWGAAWDMTRDAEVSTGDYLELYLSGIPRETDIGVVQTVMRQLRTAIDLYAAPEHIEGYTIRLADALWAWAQESEAGSDRQLAFVRGLTATATTPAQIDIVAGLLAGSTTLPGLAIDTDLRWSLLQRLAAKGRAELPEIEQELARDATATGQRQAAIARACRPTPEAKELAWADLAERDDMPNAMIESTIMGFQQGEPELLLPFRARYFGSLKDIWERRTAEMAQDLAVGLYPALLVSADTLSDTDAFLADESLHPSLRRLVTECRDGVARALRCRVRDAR